MEENCDMGLANDYLEMTPNTEATKAKLDKILDKTRQDTPYLVYMIIYDYI